MPGDELGDELASALSRVREMAGLLDPAAAEQPPDEWDEREALLLEAREWEPEDGLLGFDAQPGPDEQLVGPPFEAEDEVDAAALLDELPVQVHAQLLAATTANWRLPRLSLDVPRARTVSGLHWLTEGLYQPIALIARAPRGIRRGAAVLLSARHARHDPDVPSPQTAPRPVAVSSRAAAQPVRQAQAHNPPVPATSTVPSPRAPDTAAPAPGARPTKSPTSHSAGGKPPSLSIAGAPSPIAATEATSPTEADAVRAPNSVVAAPAEVTSPAEAGAVRVPHNAVAAPAEASSPAEAGATTAPGLAGASVAEATRGAAAGLKAPGRADPNAAEATGPAVGGMTSLGAAVGSGAEPNSPAEAGAMRVPTTAAAPAEASGLTGSGGLRVPSTAAAAPAEASGLSDGGGMRAPGTAGAGGAQARNSTGAGAMASASMPVAAVTAPPRASVVRAAASGSAGDGAPESTVAAGAAMTQASAGVEAERGEDGSSAAAVAPRRLVLRREAGAGHAPSDGLAAGPSIEAEPARAVSASQTQDGPNQAPAAETAEGDGAVDGDDEDAWPGLVPLIGRALAAPLNAVGRLDAVGLVALLFALTGIVIALGLALR